MKENCFITIDNTQTDTEGTEHYTLSTVGEYTCTGKKKRIRYQDSPATGFEGCITSLDIDPQGIVFSREGTLSTNLILHPGKRFTGHYGTPYGDLTLGVYTNEIKNELDDKGGNLDFTYSLDVNAVFYAKNNLKITVRERKKNV